MMIANLLLSACLAGNPDVTWQAPASYLRGRGYHVALTITAPEGGADVPGWLLTPAAFEVDGAALAPREERGTIDLPAGATITHRLNLDPVLQSEVSFTLRFAPELSDAPAMEVSLLEPAAEDLDFMSMDASEFGKYNVLLSTAQGDMTVELWPDVAPKHVQNFLDLTHTGFYDGTTFHRVIQNFMIQGGDPTASGTGNGPRMLEAEFSDRKHERGVLSMARQGTPGKPGPQDPLKDTASCQFFIMHQNTPALDGNYSAFGKLVSGDDTLERIANTPVQNTKPIERQEIIDATVVEAVE